jgi:20S proteasome alpha/beta subunit
VTLLVALTGRDGLVLAADSRGTFGDPSQTTAQNDSMQKAHVLSKHVAALFAGTGEVGALLAEEAKTAVGGSSMDGVTGVMESLRVTCRQKYNEWFEAVPAMQPPALLMTGQVPSRPGLNIIVGGYELDGEEIGEPRLYRLFSYQDFSPMLSDYGWMVDGIVQYALYLLNRLYEPDRTVQELTALAIYAITETASQDGKVGGPVKVVTIKPKEGCTALEDSAVSEIMSGNEKRSRALRDSFYERKA